MKNKSTQKPKNTEHEKKFKNFTKKFKNPETYPEIWKSVVWGEQGPEFVGEGSSLNPVYALWVMTYELESMIARSWVCGLGISICVVSKELSEELS